MSDRFSNRFDGAEAWSRLAERERALIGALALELALTWHGLEIGEEACDGEATRPFEAADRDLISALSEAVRDAVPQAFAVSPPPVPAWLGPVCRMCGCSQLDACDEGCGWDEPDLCTACAHRRHAA